MRFLASLCLFFSIGEAVLVPGPSGPYAVATKELPLTDTSRADPLDPTGKSKTRRLLVSLYLPVDASQHKCPAQTLPYMTPPVAAYYGQQAAGFGLPNSTYSQFQMSFCDLAKVYPCGRPPRKNTKFPLIIFDPGFGESRLIYSAMARSLASQGYIVVAVDHPFEAPAVQFPDGSVIEGADLDDSDLATLQKVLKVRTDDVTFIIKQLKDTRTTKPLLENFPGSIDCSRIAIYGHSFGGAASASVVHADASVLGGLDLDGMLIDPIMSTKISKPFILAGRKGHDAEDGTWNKFWPYLNGKKMEIAIANTQHGSFKDILLLLSTQNIPAAGRQALGAVIGTIDPLQLDKDLNAILVSFFDFVFQGKKGPLSQIPQRYANVTIVRGNI